MSKPSKKLESDADIASDSDRRQSRPSIQHAQHAPRLAGLGGAGGDVRSPLHPGGTVAELLRDGLGGRAGAARDRAVRSAQTMWRDHGDAGGIAQHAAVVVSSRRLDDDPLGRRSGSPGAW